MSVRPLRLGLGALVLAVAAGALAAEPHAPSGIDAIKKLLAQGRYAAAEQAAAAYRDEVEVTNGPESLAVADALDLWFEARWWDGKAAELETKDQVEKAIAIRQRLQGPRHPDLATSLGCLAIVMQSRGDYTRAKELADRALAIVEASLGPEHNETAGTLSIVAMILEAQGEFAEARTLLERGGNILLELFGPDDARYGQSLSLVAGLSMALGDLETARSLLEEAERIVESRFGGEHPMFANVLHNQARLHHLEGDLTGARRIYERTLSIREKALGPEHPRIAFTLIGVAELALESGDLDGARASFTRAMGIAERSQGPFHPRVARCLAGLGEVASRSGDSAAATEYHRRAAEARVRSLGAGHPSVGSSLSSLAALLLEQGEKREALESAARAEAIGRDHLVLMVRSLSEREALRYAAIRPSGLDVLLSAATEDPGTAWDAALRSRGLVFDEMAARARTLPEDPPTVRIRTELQSAAARLAHLTIRGPGQAPAESHRRLLDEARREKEEAERQLAKQSAAFRREAERERSGLAEVVDALPPRSALLAFFRYRRWSATTAVPSYLAFVVRAGGGRPKAVPLGAADEIEGLIAEWRKTLKPVGTPGEPVSEAVERSAGVRLRSRVWDPLIPGLGDAESVFVVADGDLHLVNFSALPTGRSSYLIETGPLIRMVLAERDLLGSEAKPLGEGLLALGGASFDESAPGSEVAENARRNRGSLDSCRGAAELRFPPIPASEREVREIAGLWRATRGAGSDDRGTRVLWGAGASERTFKLEAPGKRMLHIATHGFFLGGRCPSPRSLPSARSMPEAFMENMPPPVAEENPLVLSGLAMAGANVGVESTPEAEDGILTAEEAATLDLSSVDWAVLSGCDTGIGEIRSGEGVFGLRRGFQVAGVRTVIMSLLPVDDADARRWMRALYDARWGRGLETAEAVRAAGLTVLRERRRLKRDTSPVHWGAFVASGGRPLQSP